MFDILMFVGVFLGYVLVGAIWGTIIQRTEKNDQAGIFAGVLWPISIPFVGIVESVLGIIWLVQKAKMPSFSSFKFRQQKVLAYAEMPTLVLAQIVAQRIAAYPQGIVSWDDVWTSEDKNIKLRLLPYSTEFYRLTVNGKTWHSLSNRNAEKILSEAYLAAKKFNEEKEKADEEAARQLNALNAVESLLLLSPIKEN